MIEIVRKLKVGHSLAPGSEAGPLISPELFLKVEKVIMSSYKSIVKMLFLKVLVYLWEETHIQLGIFILDK